MNKLYLLLILFVFKSSVASANITILGPQTVTVGTQQTYQAYFSYAVDPSAILTWSIPGGTIVSQTITPGGPITVLVNWGYTSGNTTVSISDNISSETGNITVKLILPAYCTSADAGSDVSLCSSATSVMIGTPAVSGYSYSWSPSTGLSNPNIAQPLASPTTTTTYTLTVKRNNLLTNGDFEQGVTGFITDYAIWPASSPTCNPYAQLFSTSSPQNIYSSWSQFSDVTPNGTLMLSVDGGCIANMRVWSQTVSVATNTNYTFTGWARANAFHDPTTPITASILRVRINGVDVITNISVLDSRDGWIQFSTIWNSGANTTAVLALYNDNLQGGGNDFSIDDFYFADCGTTTDHVVVCVCPPADPPITVTVQIAAKNVVNFLKLNTATGRHCLEPRQTQHNHWPYENECFYNYLVSGYGPYDNAQPAYASFMTEFFMKPMTLSLPATGSYLDFDANDQGLYEPCLATDIVDVKLKLFHWNKTYCGANWGSLNHMYLTQPHTGNNAFTVKRMTQTLGTNSCGNSGSGITYNYDNLPATSSTDIINIPASSTAYDDYNIDVTQMVKNSLINNTSFVGFIFQQVQNSIPNNVLFLGSNGINNVVDAGEPYIELTYVRRPKRVGCVNNRTVQSDAIVPPLLPQQLQLNKKGIHIYPNPARSIVNITSYTVIENVEIYNSNGVLVRAIKGSGSTMLSVNTAILPAGIYLCKVAGQTGFQTVKLVISR